jgi:hypothetical protein
MLQLQRRVREARLRGREIWVMVVSCEFDKDTCGSNKSADMRYVSRHEERGARELLLLRGLL